MKLKAIVFDSSVLINIQKQRLKDATNKIISYYLPADKFMTKYKRQFKDLQLGKIKEEEFFNKILKELPARSAKRVREQHDKERDKNVKLNNNVESVLKTLSNSYKLGLLSNMPKCWFDKDANRLKLNSELFNTMIFSCNEGTTKPDKTLYLKMCKELKEKPDRCAYITNHDYEVEGANNTGMTVITLGSDQGDMRIENLNELVDLFSNQDDTNKNIHEVNNP